MDLFSFENIPFVTCFDVLNTFGHGNSLMRLILVENFVEKVENIYFKNLFIRCGGTCQLLNPLSRYRY